MTLLLSILLALTPALPDTCEIPPMLAEMEGSAPWEAREDVTRQEVRTEHGWYAWWQGDTCEPRAVWGRDTGWFIWTRGMREVYRWETTESEVDAVAMSLYNCLLNRRTETCRLMSDLLRTQMSKQ